MTSSGTCRARSGQLCSLPSANHTEGSEPLALPTHPNQTVCTKASPKGISCTLKHLPASSELSQQRKGPSVMIIDSFSVSYLASACHLKSRQPTTKVPTTLHLKETTLTKIIVMAALPTLRTAPIVVIECKISPMGAWLPLTPQGFHHSKFSKI